MSMDEELSRRRFEKDYDIKTSIKIQRRENDQIEVDQELELQRYMWKRENYTTGIPKRDVNYPIDEIPPYPFGDGKTISSLVDPFNEEKWGKNSVYYWRNRRGLNTTPMVWMVEPPF